MKLPEPIHQTKAQIIRWRESRQSEKPRNYLGASIIGGPCQRELWYSFRNAAIIQFDGRMLRLFNRGNREEQVFIEELRGIGCHVVDSEYGAQIEVTSHGGHMRGHLDGMVHGLPEAPKTWHVCEFKTHNDKSFQKLVKEGVEKACPEHFAQMQYYMGRTTTERAIYMAANKNDDDLHIERIEFSQAAFDRIMQRAMQVIDAPEPPARMSEDPSWWQCKMCDYRSICHGMDLPLPNCRSCAHSTPSNSSDHDDNSGIWTCARGRLNINTHDGQLAGCEDHRYIPVLLERFAEMIDANEKDNWVQYRHKITGKVFYNGDYTSAELHACHDKTILGDDMLQELRHEFDGRLV